MVEYVIFRNDENDTRTDLSLFSGIEFPAPNSNLTLDNYFRGIAASSASLDLPFGMNYLLTKKRHGLRIQALYQLNGLINFTNYDFGNQFNASVTYFRTYKKIVLGTGLNFMGAGNDKVTDNNMIFEKPNGYYTIASSFDAQYSINELSIGASIAPLPWYQYGMNFEYFHWASLSLKRSF